MTTHIRFGEPVQLGPMTPPKLFQPSTTTPGRLSIIPTGSFGPTTTTDPSPFGTSIGPDQSPPASGGFDPSSGIVPSTNNGGNQITVFAPPSGGSNTLPMPIPPDPTTIPIAPAAVVGLSPIGKVALALLGITGGVLLYNLGQRRKAA